MKIYFCLLIICIFNPTEAITFQCSYSSYDNVYSGPGNQCYAIRFQTSGNSSLVTNVTGTSSKNLMVNNVLFTGSINSKSNEDMQIPQGLLKFFPKLDFLALYNVDIDTLNGNELVEYTKLKRFDLVGGKVQYLPGNFFASTPLIEVVYLYQNQIKN